MNTLKNSRGFTLLELLLVVTLLGVMMTSLQMVLGHSMTSHRNTKKKLEQISRARFVLDRIALLIRETGFIESPAEGGSTHDLVIEERQMDSHDNTTHSLVLAGDGFFDADNDSSGAVNDDSVNDPVDKIFISLDKTDADNWKLVEILPDYGTSALADTMAQRILCEHVTAFTVSRGSMDKKKMIQLQLDLTDGVNHVSLFTRASAGKLLIL